jgi:hypothetical protein
LSLTPKKYYGQFKHNFNPKLWEELVTQNITVAKRFLRWCTVKVSPLRSSEFHIEILSSVDWQYRKTQGIPYIWNKIFTCTFAADLINYGYMAQNIYQHLKVTEYLQLCNPNSFWKYTTPYYITSWKLLYKISQKYWSSVFWIVFPILKCIVLFRCWQYVCLQWTKQAPCQYQG